MPSVTLPVTDGALQGHLATPEGAGPWPGVVVIHEAFGLTDDIRGIADRFAAQGYLALAPDFFAGRGSKLACVRAAFRELSEGSGRIFDALEA
jgi:carboxymethylenebutenolidase